MIEPKELKLTRQDGTVKTFILSKVPAIPMREVVATYPVANMPKVGEYQVSEAIMLKLMSFVAVETDGGPLALSSAAMIHNHVVDWETLARLEVAMLEYNVSFFANVRSYGSLTEWTEANMSKITSTLTVLWPQLLQAVKQPSGS